MIRRVARSVLSVLKDPYFQDIAWGVAIIVLCMLTWILLA